MAHELQDSAREGGRKGRAGEGGERQRRERRRMLDRGRERERERGRERRVGGREFGEQGSVGKPR
jgi:hypothetical protein